jgi:hypothetical protein
MMAWYWAHVSRLHVEHLSRVPAASWITVDYTNVDPAQIGRVFEFLGLEGFDEARVDAMLNARINSVWDRFKLRERFPHPRDWDSERRRRFDRIAGGTMRLLGYED